MFLEQRFCVILNFKTTDLKLKITFMYKFICFQLSVSIRFFNDMSKLADDDNDSAASEDLQLMIHKCILILIKLILTKL